MMIIICASIYILCVLLSVAVIFNVAGLPTHLWISTKLVWFGKWIPQDLGLMRDATLSRWNSGYFELIFLIFLTFITYGICALFIYSMNAKGKNDCRESGPDITINQIIWVVTIICGFIYIFTPGILASDIYSYANYGRILAIYWQSPYFVPPSAFPNDPTYHLLFWKNTISTYGPVWMGISSLLALIAGSHPFRIIIIFRIFAFAMHLINISLVGATLRTIHGLRLPCHPIRRTRASAGPYKRWAGLQGMEGMRNLPDLSGESIGTTLMASAQFIAPKKKGMRDLPDLSGESIGTTLMASAQFIAPKRIRRMWQFIAPKRIRRMFAQWQDTAPKRIQRMFATRQDTPNRWITLGMLLYAWNPLVLMESSLGGHNDVLLMTFILLGFYLYAQIEKKTILSFYSYLPPLIAFTLAALVKYSALPIIVIFIIVIFIRTLRRTMQGISEKADLERNGRNEIGSLSRDKSRVRKISFNTCIVHQNPLIIACSCALIASGISLMLALVCYAPFWIGHSISEIIASFISLPSAQQVFNSLLFAIDSYHSVHLLPTYLQLLAERTLWNRLMIIAILIPLVIGILALWRNPTTRTIALISLASLSGSLLFTPWFFPWYITWLVGLAVICLPERNDRLSQALFAFTITISITAFAAYYSTLIGWSLLNAHPPHVSWTIWMCLMTFGIPLIVSLVFLLNWRQQTRPNRISPEQRTSFPKMKKNS